MNTNQRINNKIYINPNFSSNTRNAFSNNRTDSIHINPNFSKLSSAIPLLPSRVCYINPKIYSQLAQSNTSVEPEKTNVNNYLVHSKTKIVKIANTTQITEKKYTEEVKKLVAPRKPSYKFIRNSSSKPPNSTPSIQPKVTPQITSHIPKQIIKNNIDTKPNIFTKVNKLNVSKKNINTKPSNSIQNDKKLSPSNCVFIGREKFISLPGRLVKIKTSHVNTTKLIKRVLINGLTYIRKTDNLFVLENAHKSYKKTNILCPKYVKTGKCKKNELGKCPLVHNPKHIVVCKLYLRGMCKIEDCSLSHNVTLEKMPTCKFFLEGCCTRDQCPYLHVKVGKNVKLCSQFIKGFCPLGKECPLKHLNICPKFYESSKCDDKNCTFPHSVIDSPKLVIPNYKAVVSKQKKCLPSKQDEDDCVKSSRYFEESDDCDKKSVSCENEKEKKYDLSNRPKIGKLPSFISLD